MKAGVYLYLNFSDVLLVALHSTVRNSLAVSCRRVGRVVMTFGGDSKKMVVVVGRGWLGQKISHVSIAIW